MAKNIVIAVPCWGEHHRRIFLRDVLPTHRAALAELHRTFRGSIGVRYVVQTDSPVEIARALGDLELTLVPSPSDVKNPMRHMAGAHGHAIATAAMGERVILLNADIMVSIETFAAVERQFRRGKKAIVCAGTRTLPWMGFAPGPLPARALLAWTMKRPHPITTACFWGSGRCHLPWGVYFRDGDNVILRAFHLHPLAVVKDRDLPFEGTIDLDLVERFAHEDIHIVTSADELALAEISPNSKVFADKPWLIDVGQIMAWALRGARPMHWWNFRHRISVTGHAERVKCDSDVADEVLRLCPYPEAIAALV